VNLAPYRVTSTLACADGPLRGVAEMVLAGRNAAPAASALTLSAPTPEPGDVTRALALPPPRDLSGGSRSLASAIVGRRSGSLTPGPLDAATLAALLAAVDDTPGLMPDASFAPVLHPAIFAVDAVPAGTYRYARDAHALLPIRDVTRETVARAALLQHEHGTGAAVLFLVMPLSRWLLTYGDRGYRGAAFAAGAWTDRLYLVAETLGLTYTATGGFAPSVVDDLLGLDGCERTAFFAFAVGGPRRVTPRVTPRVAPHATQGSVPPTADRAGGRV